MAARIVFVTGWLDVREDALAVRSAIHSAIVVDHPGGLPLYVVPKFVTVTPTDGNLPVYVNPIHVVMVKTGAAEGDAP